jgi:hypothetical protein
MFTGEAFGAFELHHKNAFDQEISKIVSHPLAFVRDRKRGFDGGPKATKAEFFE